MAKTQQSGSDGRDLIDQYFRAFEAQDAAALVALFTDEAQIVSSVFGIMAPREFYPMLFTLCRWTRVEVHRIYRSADSGTGDAAFAVHFDYRAKPVLGRVAQVDCVDLFELDGKSEKITRLTPVCDSRPRKVPGKSLLKALFRRR